MKLYVLALAVVALPVVTALPGACGDPCVIAASSVPGYVPIASAIPSGSSVVWHSTDITHVTRDQTIGSSTACFEVAGEGGEDAPAVRFDVTNGALVATVEGESTTCGSAMGSPDAGFLLPYFCALHPTMRATLVVTTT